MEKWIEKYYNTEELQRKDQHETKQAIGHHPRL